MKSPLPLAFIGGSLQSAVGRTHHIATRMDTHRALAAIAAERGSGSVRFSLFRVERSAWAGGKLVGIVGKMDLVRALATEKG